jgi:hypothetical protein
MFRALIRCKKVMTAAEVTFIAVNGDFEFSFRSITLFPPSFIPRFISSGITKALVRSRCCFGWEDSPPKLWGLAIRVTVNFEKKQAVLAMLEMKIMVWVLTSSVLLAWAGSSQSTL